MVRTGALSLGLNVLDYDRKSGYVGPIILPGAPMRMTVMTAQCIIEL